MTEHELWKELYARGYTSCPHELLPHILAMIQEERASIIAYCNKKGEHIIALDLKARADKSGS